MNAPTTTSTYRDPEGQLIHNVVFNTESGYYKWKDDQGKPCILKADRFEQMMTPVLTPDNIDPASDLPPYQQRVIAEKAELDEKARKLSDFIGLNPKFTELDPREQELLRVQNDLMWQYSDVLGTRIAAFNPPVILADEVNDLPSEEQPAVTGFLADPVTVNEDFALPTDEQTRDDFGDTEGSDEPTL